MAVQETKLSSLPLEHARSSLRHFWYTLQHGAVASSGRVAGAGARGGVGLLVSSGVAVSPLLHLLNRRLHAMARLHGVMIPPRPALPFGLRIYSVYAPLPWDPGRVSFNNAFVDFMASLDMQIPTLLLGDFDGTMAPNRDHSSGARPGCALLSRLVGSGGPFTDLQMAVSLEE